MCTAADILTEFHIELGSTQPGRYATCPEMHKTSRNWRNHALHRGAHRRRVGLAWAQETAWATRLAYNTSAIRGSRIREIHISPRLRDCLSTGATMPPRSDRATTVTHDDRHSRTPGRG
jgi:hypothetical protein